MKELCIESGIKRELITPYNPQQNAVVERKNETIMEAKSAMLHEQDLPINSWLEAARTTMYVKNKTPHSVLNKNTLEEDFLGKKP